MGEETLASLLADAPPCQNLTQAETVQLAGAGQLRSYAAGEDLLVEGATGDEMLLLLKGRAEVWKQDVEKGEPVRLNDVLPGEILGEVACLRSERRLATVRAAEPCLAFGLHRDAFERMLNDGEPAAYKLALKMARNLADRLAWMNDKVFGLLRSHDCGPRTDDFDSWREEILREWEA